MSTRWWPVPSTCSEEFLVSSAPVRHRMVMHLLLRTTCYLGSEKQSLRLSLSTSETDNGNCLVSSAAAAPYPSCQSDTSEPVAIRSVSEYTGCNVSSPVNSDRHPRALPGRRHRNAQTSEASWGIFSSWSECYLNLYFLPSLCKSSALATISN